MKGDQKRNAEDQTREAQISEIPLLEVETTEPEKIKDETKDAVTRALSKEDFASAGKNIKSGVDRGKEIAENMDLQTKLNVLVIKIKTEYGPRLESIDKKWKKIPASLQSYIVHTGPLAALPAVVFPAGLMPAAAACAAASFLVKTGLLSFKGEIKGGKIDLNKSVTVGEGLKKFSKLVVKGLQYFFEDLEGLEEVLEPIVEGAQYGDKMCAVAKDNLYRHLKKTGRTTLEIESGPFKKAA